MLSAAILVSDNMLSESPGKSADQFELVEQMGKLTPAFDAQGIKLDLVRWKVAASEAKNYDAMLPLFVWDYFENNQETFLAEMAQVEELTRLLNSYQVLKWNSHKRYLEDLAEKNAPTIRTLNVENVNEQNVESAFESLGTDTLVIKPTIGGGAWRQVLYERGTPFPSSDELPPESALIQAFLPNVRTEGEYSFIYFNGKFSHAVNKKPKNGDYRIQSAYGGIESAYDPASSELATAETILERLEFLPLYARVDLIRGTDQNLKLIELEMIEPYLYLPFASGEGADNTGAQLLAAALKKRLT
jgi:hypothetical protein